MKDQIEKQAIEEMAKVIDYTFVMAKGVGAAQPSPRMIATDLYEKGWRKQSEGEWVKSDNTTEQYGYLYMCSYCGGLSFLGKFCPNCGAKMKGGAE